jgi:hypothetical protein
VKIWAKEPDTATSTNLWFGKDDPPGTVMLNLVVFEVLTGVAKLKPIKADEFCPALASVNSTVVL